jgi:hypothetical protein
MTYPKTILTRTVRRSIMAFLFIVFFTVSPIILLYTAGYRYDFKTHQIKQTGVLNIDAEPDNIKAYLDDVPLNKNLPIYLPNRAPGTYTIKLTAEGYRDWEKDINIESKRTTYIKDIILFKESVPVQILKNLDKRIIDLQGSFDGGYITILTEEDNIFETYIYNTENKNLTSLSRIKAIVKPKIDWSPFSNYLIIETVVNKKQSLQILDATNQDNSKVYTYTSPTEYQWAKNTFLPSIYLQTKETIQLLTTNGEQDISLVSSTISNWFAENQNNLWTYEGKILTNGDTKYNLEDDVINIIDINNSRIIYQANNETKIVKLDNDKITETHSLPTQQIIYNHSTNRWETWSWWELWTIHNNGNVELFNRSGEKMINVNPLDQHGVLLLSNESKITGLNPSYYISHELFSNGKIKKIFTNVAEREIYFWGTVANQTGIFELEY